jgi:glucose-1-phosphate thymidylyltransferase
MARELIGLVPAAGHYRRGDFPMPKECMPIGDGRILADHVVDSMIDAGVNKIIFVISEDRQPLIEHYSQPDRLCVPHVFVVDKLRKGIPYSILWAYPWIKDADVLFGMPDTLFQPARAMGYLTGSIYWNNLIDADTRADVVLGLFPTDNPYRFGMVKINDAHDVVWCFDKPLIFDKESLEDANLWGIALWRPAFTRFLFNQLQSIENPKHEMVLTNFFSFASIAGLSIKGFPFLHYVDSFYFDVADEFEYERACMIVERGIF